MSRDALIMRTPARYTPPRPGHATASFDAGPPAGGLPVINVRGTLDRRCAAQARRAMCEALTHAPKVVVVDLTGVTAIDRAGAVLLVAMVRHARRLGSSMRVVGVQPAVRTVLRERGVERLIPEKA